MQLKNAVMQMWLATKDKRKKPSFSEVLKMIIQKRKQEARDKAMGIDRSQEKEDEVNQSVLQSQNLDPESKKYYDLYKDVFNLNMKILDMGGEIDSVERRIIQLQSDKGKKKSAMLM